MSTTWVLIRLRVCFGLEQDKKRQNSNIFIAARQHNVNVLLHPLCLGFVAKLFCQDPLLIRLFSFTFGHFWAFCFILPVPAPAMQIKTNAYTRASEQGK